jgi:ribose 5-phosphate isomerase B
MKIFIATDHEGYVLKETLLTFLKAKGYEVIDKGAYSYNEEDDYPDFAAQVAREVSKDPEGSRGVILGGTGEAEAIVSNRFPHVRAIAYYGKATPVVDVEAGILARSRKHNNSNVLSLGARYFTEESMMEVVNYWLITPYMSEERHIRRLAKIDAIKVD